MELKKYPALTGSDFCYKTASINRAVMKGLT
jgi:hypothetical protein